MKLILKCTSILIILSAIIYGCAAFVNSSFNPATWEIADRAICVMIFWINAIMIVPIVLVFED